MPVNLAPATTRLAELVRSVPDDALLNPCDIPSASSWTMSARSPSRSPRRHGVTSRRSEAHRPSLTRPISVRIGVNASLGHLRR
jgi:hypothetical protein